MPTIVPEYYEGPRPRFRKMPDWLRDQVAAEVKAVLHSGYDAMRNRQEDTRNEYLGPNDPHYCEALGIMRGLHLMGYGYFGSSNLNAVREKKSSQPEQNLIWWLHQLNREVRTEEGMDDESYRCDYCMDRYGKDTRAMIDSGRFDFRFVDTNHYIYMYMNGPMLVRFMTRDGTFLGVALEDNRFLYLRVDLPDIVAYHEREVTLRDLILRSDFLEIDTTLEVERVHAGDLDERDLPTEDSYLPKRIADEL